MRLRDTEAGSSHEAASRGRLDGGGSPGDPQGVDSRKGFSSKPSEGARPCGHLILDV